MKQCSHTVNASFVNLIENLLRCNVDTKKLSMWNSSSTTPAFRGGIVPAATFGVSKC